MLRQLKVFSIEEKIWFALDMKEPILEISKLDSEETKVSEEKVSTQPSDAQS